MMKIPIRSLVGLALLCGMARAFEFVSKSICWSSRRCNGWRSEQLLYTTAFSSGDEVENKDIGAEVSLYPSSTQPQTRAGQWSQFDYKQHWYPVSWVCDLRPNQPTKVTLFDIDYVVAVDKSRRNVTVALRDLCPHKAAALSEGRWTSTGFLQCAYHGWSFHGTNGNCVQIPQAIGGSSKSSRACANAIPATIHQDMLWLWPGPPQVNYPKPPSIPEMDDPNFRVTSRVVRDFPMVDWTLLVSNILDPDHGLFAHQAAPFDWYSADTEHPVKVEESFDGPRWILRSSVPAVKKLLQRDERQRQCQCQQGKSSSNKANFFKRILLLFNKGNAKKENDQRKVSYLATSTFIAPTTICLTRRENTVDRSTRFVSAFWVCPTGTGQSRFFSAAIAKGVPSWFRIPRWMVHLTLNNFLDQDTVLVASQQPAVLQAEAMGIAAPRKSLFQYSSPTDVSVSRIDQFWDATASQAPNRVARLHELSYSGQLRHTPDRKIVLDRQIQHLQICPDSQNTVRNLVRLRNTAIGIVITWCIGTLRQTAWSRAWPLALFLALVGGTSERLRREFYYCYPAWKRDRDLRTIPSKIWLDPIPP